MNETIVGPASPRAVVELAIAMMNAAGVDALKLRKDYTQAIELLFSLPVDARVDERKFFVRCVEWAGERMGQANILTADVHRDESTPHCHVLLLPLVDGKMRGSELLGRAATAALRDSFYKDVARQFGLSKPTGKLAGAGRALASRAVLDALESSQDAILRSAAWAVVKREIERNPAPYVEFLGIELQPAVAKPGRTMAQIFTSPGKGPKTERSHPAPASQRSTKPIGFTKGQDAVLPARVTKPIGFEMGSEDDRNLSCVGFGDSVQQIPAQLAPPATSTAPALSRPELARRAHQEAVERVVRPRAPFPQTKVATVISDDPGGFQRVPDGDPLPEGW